MANIIKLLNLIKWNTDEDHPLTQESLRLLSHEANECMGYKSTFKRQLLSIADAFNDNKPEKDWRIVFPGYKLHKDNSEHYYTGPIFYRHEITTEELHFIIRQLHGISFELKTKLILKLIKNLGSKYYTSSDNSILENIDFDNLDSIDFTDNNVIHSLKGLIQINEFPTYITKNLYSNLNIIEDAIKRKKLLSFTPSLINKYGEAQPTKDGPYLVSPYRVIFYKGYYWLIGNRRLGIYEKKGLRYYQYSSTLDIYRIDKILNVTIAKNYYELRSKTYFLTNPHFYKQLEFLSSKIHIFKDGTKIDATHVTDNYGFVEFEILWDNFSKSSIKDYSFIFDTFGHNFTIKENNNNTITCVYAQEECFIDWALTFIDKIKILDTGCNANIIKAKIKDKLQNGLNNL
mgnify:CR=1 FL=1